MNEQTMIRKLVLLVFLAMFISACQSTTGEVLQPEEDETTAGTDLIAEEHGASDSGDSLITSNPLPADDDHFNGSSGSDISSTLSEEEIALLPPPTEMPEEVHEESGSLLSQRVIYFEFNSAKISDESLAILESHGNFIAGNSAVRVRLEGHADERGSREFNIALGDRRAQSVRRVLLFQGASLDQLETISFGEEQPVALGHTESEWAKNRRVELVYSANSP